MPHQPTDEDIIQEAYADRLRAIFDNYIDVAPSDPEGAKAKFVAGVNFLRNIRNTALQVLHKEDAWTSDAAMMPATNSKSA